MADTEATAGDRGESEREHEVMAHCVEAWNAGGEAAAAAVLAAHPELAPRLRERLAKLERAGLLGPGDDATAIPERLGEFKLLRRLGSGGMGVVFLAEQETLGRTVALKLMRPEQRFFPGARARFQREVEAIARLGDPGIVPIYSVGQDQGIDFFAMEFVRGASLGDVLAALHATPPSQLVGRDLAVVAAARAEAPAPGTTALPEMFAGSWVQTCCRILVRMARAAQHAHERGVVHRDLKPTNTMVTPSGRVLLLDFGLAAASGASRITRTGAQLGTLHYMAPEQLEDGAVDARTDVYALGVTLHEMLALRSPFTATSGEGLRWQILHGRAASLREQNDEVPRDLETIFAVARDRDPARRYATAAALADDLERFLQHRPIAARPIGPWLRVRRWQKRHPAPATAIALLLAAGLATPFLVHLVRHDAEFAIAGAREQARTNLGSAVAVIEGVLANVRGTTMNQAAVLDTERRRQLDGAVALVRRLRRENADDPEVLELFVDAMQRVTNVRIMAGDYAGAIEAVDEAESALGVLTQLRPRSEGPASDTPVPYLAAGLRLSRGNALGKLGRTSEAAGCWQQVIDEFDAMPLAAMNEEIATTLFTCHNNLSSTLRHDPDLVLKHLRRSLELEAHVWPKGLPPERVEANVGTFVNVALMQIAKRDIDGAESSLGQVFDRVQKALALLPDEAELLRTEARAHWAMGHVHTSRKRLDEAVRVRTRAVQLMKVQADRFPHRLPYANDVATMTADLAEDRHAAGDRAGAMESVLDAIARSEALVGKAPGTIEYRVQLAKQLSFLARLQHEGRERETALHTLGRAIDVQRTLASENPREAQLHADAADYLTQRAAQQAEIDDWEAALIDLRLGRDHYEAALAAGLPLAFAWRYSRLLILLGRAESANDDIDAAVAAVARAQQIRAFPAAMLRQIGDELGIADRKDFQALLRAATTKGK